MDRLIKVLYYLCKRSGNEIIIFSPNGENNRFTSYSRRGVWNHKRKKFSIERVIRNNSVSICSNSKYYSTPTLTAFLMIKREDLLKLLYNFKTYLNNCGIEDKYIETVGDVVL